MTRQNIIGIEFIAADCADDNWDENQSHYFYEIDNPYCSGSSDSSIVIKHPTYTSITKLGSKTTTSALVNMGLNSSTFSVIRNEKGDHIWLVHYNYDGLINGIDTSKLSTANDPQYIYVYDTPYGVIPTDIDIDSDEDGVIDCEDKCEGYDDNDDMDGDGAPDACDGCPENPDLVEPDPECGCEDSSTSDEDNDGVGDCKDECKGTFFLRTDMVDSDGCVPCKLTLSGDKSSIKAGESTSVNANMLRDEYISFSVTTEGPDVEIETEETDYGYIITALKTSGEGTVIVTATDPYADEYCSKEFRIEVDGCVPCEGSECEDVYLDSIHVSLKLGKTINGKSAGRLIIDSDTISPSLATPSSLKLSNQAVTVNAIYDETILRQIVASEYFVDIVALDNYRYEIRYYLPEDMGDFEGNVYQIVNGSTPEMTWLVQNPDASDSIYNRLTISKFHSSSIIAKYEFVFDEATNTWTLDEGEGLSITSLKTELLGDLEVKTETVKNNLNEVASVTQKTYKTFSGKKRTIEIITDPEDVALVTTIDYYEEPGCQIGSCGRISLKTNPDGSWVKYQYDAEGRILKEIKSWLDLPATASDDEVMVIDYDYSLQDSSDTGSQLHTFYPRLVTEYIEGIITSKTYYVYQEAPSGTETIITEQCSDMSTSFADITNLRTVTVTNPYAPVGENKAESGKIQSITYPDGKLETFTYEYGVYIPDTLPSQPGVFTSGNGFDIKSVQTFGTVDKPSGVAYKTSRITTISDNLGREILQSTEIFNGSTYDQINWTIYEIGAHGHIISTYNSDGTTTEADWGCCNKNYYIDSDGITNVYGYDDLQRRNTVTKLGFDGTPDIITTYSFDAAGRTLTTTKSSGSLVFTTSQYYDRAGRLDYSVDESNIITNYDYSDSNLTSIVIKPGGGTEITEKYLDGQIKSITGTSSVERYFTYGVNSDGSKWTQINTGSPSSSMWQKTTTDQLGRIILIEKADYSEPVMTEHHYNDMGQLFMTEMSGKASTLYMYDELGNQIRTGLDIDENSLLEKASNDRITDNETIFEYADGLWWKTSSTLVYSNDNDDTPTTVSTQMQRLTGLGVNDLVSEIIQVDTYGNQTLNRIYIDNDRRSKIQTTHYPDADNETVSETVNGLLAYSLTKTGVRTDYAYDDLGRLTGMDDARTGMTTTHYNDNHQIDYVEDTALNRTLFNYDPVTGRKTSMIDAKGLTTYYRYNDMGQITHIWGSGSEPVQYVYDSYSRLSQMHTFRNGSGWDNELWPEGSTGDADITTWHYQDSTGLLLGKEDNLGNKTTYTYTPTGGRIHTRTWARTIDSTPVMTTYEYDPLTTELTDIIYTDETPDISFSYDRLGRKDTVTDALGTRVFGYNSSLQQKTESITGLYTGIITQTYDETTVPGRATGFHTDDGYTVSWGFEPDTGRLHAIDYIVNGVSDSLIYTYENDSDLISGTSTSTGMVTDYYYEAHRDLKTLIQNSFNGTLVSLYESHYDTIGQRDSTQASGLAPAQAMGEKVAQLWFQNVEPTQDGFEVLPSYREYNFDSIGNRVDTTNWDSSSDSFQMTDWEANSLNQYATKTTEGLTNNFTYDEDGNMTSASGMTLAYNAENRLIECSPEAPVTGDQKVSFIYDYMGRRVKKIVSVYQSGTWIENNTTLFVYDGWNLIQEIDSTENPQKSYVWGLDISQTMHGSGGIGGLISSIDASDGALYLYIYEPNGNVAQLINAYNGEISKIYEYDAFGNITFNGGMAEDNNPFRFSTKYWDNETSMGYWGYRYYCSDLGRWNKMDPINDTGFHAKTDKKYIDNQTNWAKRNNYRFEDKYKSGYYLKLNEIKNSYAYIFNNPINNSDPTGLCTWTGWMSAAGGSALFGGAYISVSLNSECCNGVKVVNATYRGVIGGLSLGIPVAAFQTSVTLEGPDTPGVEDGQGHVSYASGGGAVGGGYSAGWLGMGELAGPQKGLVVWLDGGVDSMAGHVWGSGKLVCCGE